MTTLDGRALRWKAQQEILQQMRRRRAVHHRGTETLRKPKGIFLTEESEGEKYECSCKPRSFKTVPLPDPVPHAAVPGWLFTGAQKRTYTFALALNFTRPSCTSTTYSTFSHLCCLRISWVFF